jgi:hypothetical protein
VILKMLRFSSQCFIKRGKQPGQNSLKIIQMNLYHQLKMKGDRVAELKGVLAFGQEDQG